MLISTKDESKVEGHLSEMSYVSESCVEALRTKMRPYFYCFPQGKIW